MNRPPTKASLGGYPWQALLLFVGLSACFPAFSIPTQVETNTFTALPPEFKAMSSPDSSQPDLVRSCLLETPLSDDAPVYYSIHHSSGSDTNPAPPLWSDQAGEVKIIGRHSERLYNLDLDILDAEMQTNDTLVRKRSVQIPLRADLFRLDLTTPVKETNTMDTVMKEVVRNLAAQNTPSPRQETEGYMTALIYLAMVAVVLLVAISRR